MKKLLLSVFFFLLVGIVSNPVYGLIVTDNVDRDNFQYEVGYKFSSSDTAVSSTSLDVATDGGSVGHNFYYTISRSNGRVVGMSVAGNKAVTVGTATFDVTINGRVTGIQTALEPTFGTIDSAVGISGSKGPQYAYIRQDRADTRTAQGFRPANSREDWHSSDHPYGRATPLTAGNRIGVQITTTSDYFPPANAYVVVIYVLE